MAVDSDLLPTALIIDELRSEDPSARLASMQKLHTVAAALGPARTREELVPFVAESVDDEDEVVLALASQLGRLVPLVGGPEHAVVLLPVLELLAGVEESSVRDQAVLSINTILEVLSDADARAHAWPLVERLVARDWFTARTSACGVLPRVLARLPDAKPTSGGSAAAGRGAAAGAAAAAPPPAGMDVDGESSAAAAAAAAATRGDAFSLFFRLANDDTPMVRRAACLAFSDVATALAGGRIAGSGSGSSSDESGALLQVEDGSPAKAAAAAAAATASSRPLSDGYNVDTGDVSNSAVPPPVPPAVRVAAASPAAGDAAARQLLPLLLDTFSKDDQDSVRLLAMDVATALAKLLPHGPAPGGVVEPLAAAAGAGGPAARAEMYASASGVRDSIVGVVSALAGDKSWRVRWSVANRFAEFSHAVVLGGAAPPQPTVAGSAAVAPAAGCVPASKLLPLFERLLADGEAEVRTAAAYRVSDVALLVGTPATQAMIMPLVDRLSDDASEHVRAALASVLLGIAPLLGREGTIASLLPLLLRMLRDATPQVRLNVISRLEVVNGVIGLAMLSQSLVPAILELASDKQWRVRLAIIEFLPLLGSQLGADFFDATLTSLCVRWLSDSVHAIRQAAVGNLRKLTEVFGPAWAQRVLFPRITSLHAGEPSYLVRLTALHAIAAVTAALQGSHQLQRQLLAVLLAFASDPVPNLRFNTAKVLERIAPTLLAGDGDAAEGGSRAQLVRPVLSALVTNDRDEDVRYYARRALGAYPE